MEFKKCLRCGCFFVSNDNVCCNCTTKDSLEISKLENYISNSNVHCSISELAVNTGISEKNIYRFLNNNENIKNFINLN